MHAPAIIDCGTGYSKIGFAGNDTPLHVVPTVVSSREGHVNSKSSRSPLADLDFEIGHYALENQSFSRLTFPIRHGIISDWNAMEKFWERTIFGLLRCDPEDHPFILTEPPMNPPENREYAAEVMFESFNVPSLYIGVQAVLALAASFLWSSSTNSASAGSGLSGTVIDAGDGVTHIIPIIDGYVLPSAVKHIPIGGKDVTHFIQELVRERECTSGGLPQEESFDVAKGIKETQCFVSNDLLGDWKAFASKPKEHPIYRYTGKRDGNSLAIEVGFEKFLAPQALLDPSLLLADYKQTLAESVDECIQRCPIDARRMLYKNISLSGGSTMFPNFAAKLNVDITSLLRARGQENVEVEIRTNKRQKYAVWYGASKLATLPEFQRVCCTSKAEYEEWGSAIFRQSKAIPFGA
jgi:actin-related protein 3